MIIIRFSNFDTIDLQFIASMSAILHYLSPASAAADRPPDTTTLVWDASIAKSNIYCSLLSLCGERVRHHPPGFWAVVESAAPPSTSL